MDPVRIAYAPTRRSIFSAPEALRFRDLTAQRLAALDVDFVDIDDINDEGLLYAAEDLPAILAKFRAADIDGLFVPHCNFGTEYVVARLARELNVPVLLWGPRDERPDEQGVRLRDSQCGLFATGKVLRRFQVPFTYMTNCHLEDPAFARGIADFQRVCRVVRVFREIRILQISTRPFDFLTTMCNEGELLERFNIQLAPIPMPELTSRVRAVRAADEHLETIAHIRAHMDVEVSDEALANVAALTVAMRNLARDYDCSAIAIQCWDALQGEIGIMPCTANAILADEGLPVVCETDIHGAVTALLAQAASRGEHPILFADWTVRHPDNDNGELLQHCGPWPLSMARNRPVLGRSLAFEHPGSVAYEAKHGELSLVRFDGDNGEYSLLLGNAKAIEGPYTMGTYLWIEVENWSRLETKLVEGPYIHHCVAVHGDVVPVLYEACKYIGITPDLYDENEAEIRAYLRGE